MASSGGVSSGSALSLTADRLVYSDASAALVSAGAAADGQFLGGVTGSTPQLYTLGGTANQVTVTINAGLGTITLSTPQDIHTGASPTFAGLTIGASGINSSGALFGTTGLFSGIAVGVGGDASGATIDRAIDVAPTAAQLSSTNMAGVYNRPAFDVAKTNGMVYRASPRISASAGVLTNLFGYWVENATALGSGTVGTFYGVYVGALSAGTTANWGIYVVSNESYFGGKVTVNSGGIVVTGNSTITGTLGGITTLTATTVIAALTGNASTATALATARNINGVAFDGTGNITVTAAAGTLTGATLAAGVTASSLTSVGTLTGLTVSALITITSGGLKVTSGNVGIATDPATNMGLRISSVLTVPDASSGFAFFGDPIMSIAASATATIFGMAFAPKIAYPGAGNTVTATYVHIIQASTVATSGAAAGTINLPSVMGIYVQKQTLGTSSNYGIYIEAFDSSASISGVAPVNNYGIYINAPSGASGVNYGIFCAGSVAFTAGVNVGTATVAPTGSVKATGEFMTNASGTGVASYVSYTGSENTGTGRNANVGTIKMSGANAAQDSVGFIKVMIGTTARYIPVFAAN